MGNEWEKVPGDLLRKIEQRIILYVDKISFSCVCKSWQLELPNHTQFRLPLLLLPSDNNLDGATHEFLSIVDNKTYYLDLHKLHNFKSVLFQGSSHGWVVASEISSQCIFMFNPLTGFKIQLPSLLKFPKQIRKCVVSSNPSLSDDYIVVAIFHGFSSLAYTKCGDDQWNPIQCNEYFVDIIFYEGRLYGLTRFAQLVLIEIHSSNPQLVQITATTSEWVLKHAYLVNSRARLFMVEQLAESVAEEVEDHKILLKYFTSGFDVYEIDFGARRWSSSLTDIGDDILFVGSQVFFSGRGRSSASMSASTKDCPATGFKENTIHFFEARSSHDAILQDGSIDMGVFYLKTRSIEALPAFKRSRTQVVVSTPIWFTPTTY